MRVVVIDNSLGSLAASDPYQNPPEAQLPWLESVLADARAKGIPVIVMGSRSLNTGFSPKLNVASDGDQVARVLVSGGASAYVFDRPEENRELRIPSGAAESIPSFGTGTLGYRSDISGVVGSQSADSLFGDSGVMVLEIGKPASGSNVAGVRARLIPVIEDLSLEATDGTLLRRSRPALFRGLGRRPRGGDRWGRASAGSGTPEPSGGDPYTLFPPNQCLIAGCSSRMVPEYSFTSSDPDIADFVRQDPASTNLRKPYLDANDKVVTDNTSGLLCPFNAGTTTVTVSAGGYSYSERVTVLDGSVQRPCGTRPLRPDRFKRAASVAPPPAPPPPSPAPGGSPPVEFTPPPPPPPPLAPPPAVRRPRAEAAAAESTAAGVHPSRGPAGRRRAGDRPAAAAADRPAAAAGRRAGPYLPGRGKGRGGGGDRGIAGLLAPPAGGDPVEGPAVPARPGPARGIRRGSARGGPSARRRSRPAAALTIANRSARSRR